MLLVGYVSDSDSLDVSEFSDKKKGGPAERQGRLSGHSSAEADDLALIRGPDQAWRLPP
jgi:hypothetical protein